MVSPTVTCDNKVLPTVTYDSMVVAAVTYDDAIPTAANHSTGSVRKQPASKAIKDLPLPKVGFYLAVFPFQPQKKHIVINNKKN